MKKKKPAPSLPTSAILEAGGNIIFEGSLDDLLANPHFAAMVKETLTMFGSPENPDEQSHAE